MADPFSIMGHAERYALPLHLQRLENSLALPTFLNFAENVLNSSSSDEVENNSERRSCHEERRSSRSRLFNAELSGGEREALRNALISDTSDDSLDDDHAEISESRFQQMLQRHVGEKKMRRKFYSKPENTKYLYFGSGLLSNYDKYSEGQEGRSAINDPDASYGIRQSLESRDQVRGKRGRRPLNRDNSIDNSLDMDDRGSDEETRDGIEDDVDSKPRQGRGRPRRKLDKSTSPEVMAARRRKIFSLIAKKEVGKCQRSRVNNHKEVAQMLKKVAHLCTKHWKQNALQSQKNMKETLWRNKRLAREMQSYWKRYERVERDARRKQEKEAEEQRRMDLEFMEAKRQQRKLNFLITQTELYAHFISKKFGASDCDKDAILSQLNDEVTPRLTMLDDYDSEQMKWKAENIAKNAVNAEKARTRSFDSGVGASLPVGGVEERPQPAMFKGTLKHYQLKGMNWLANLYDEGINGILADEMGLGKTVQSLAFLCHIAEKYAVWGPFLIISPASTLHNWQQEIERFVPDFKVVPYWGNVHERRILRQFWDTKHLHTRNASFHIVVTSYQLIVSDFKYFNRIKWQYLILDEAQAIKSSNSQRWKLLLGFSCRNRLLLSGTPIQNSMAELWALLHFIMPTLFDNHEEFSEWFSKDIEGQAENKTRIDEKHLSRLHLILKPFMLRRIKKDVENELSDKIEVMVYCPLTTRQRLLYAGLKQKIRVEDLLAGLSGRAGPAGDDPSRNITSNLMNLVMQFRKVCNHPELFERREARSPLWLPAPEFNVPKLIYEHGLLWRTIPSLRHLTHSLLSIFTVENIHASLAAAGCFSFLKFIGMSASQAHAILLYGVLAFWMSLEDERHKAALSQHWGCWSGQALPSLRLLVGYADPLRPPHSRSSAALQQLVFTRVSGPRNRIYTHARQVHHAMAETLQHRVLRTQKIRLSQPEEVAAAATALKSPPIDGSGPRKAGKPPKCLPNLTSNSDEALQEFLVPEFPFVQRPPVVFECEPTAMPEFLYRPSLRVQSKARVMYASCRNSAWEWLRHTWCGQPEGFDTVWYGHPSIAECFRRRQHCFGHVPVGGLLAAYPQAGWSNIVIPDKHTLVADAGKLYVLDGLLKRLKEGGHRVLIYSQMTRMIDLLEEYMWHRKHTYIRLDGSSKISERRDMVADFQSRADIFVFLLSTRAGGLGINLTAADTVIFYDSDWNPTVDQQAMDRAHRLGQTKQVTVYRLICKGTIEERMLQRAREKSEIQRMVISGGDFKPDLLKTKEVVSLLLDDEEMKLKYQQKQAERTLLEDKTDNFDRKFDNTVLLAIKQEPIDDETGEQFSRSSTQSPARVEREKPGFADDNSSDLLDVDSPSTFSGSMPGSSLMNPLGIGSVRVRPVVRGSKRGRPRGVGRGGSNASSRKRAYDADIKMPDELFLTAESPSSSGEPSSPQKSRGVESSPGVRRGPGRPRTKPIGPAMQGTRGPRGRGGRRSRARRAPQPLQVPLRGTAPTSNPYQPATE